MPNVTFSYTSNTSISIYVTLSNGAIFGPTSGAQTLTNITPGGVYTLSCSSGGPGGAAFGNYSSNSIGVDDRQGLTDGYVFDSTGGNWFAQTNGYSGFSTQQGSYGSFTYGASCYSYNGAPCQSQVTSGNNLYVLNTTAYSPVYVKGQLTQILTFGNFSRYNYQQGPDYDYNDFIVYVDVGFFSGTTYYAPYDPLSVTSFTASPNPQTSSSGTPSYTTTLYWTTTGGSGSFNYTINPGGYSGTTGSSGSCTVSNLPQSTAGSNSPASQTYTITISDVTSIDSRLRQSASASTSASAYNDNYYNLSSYPPSTTSTGRPLNNLEPSTTYIITIGTITSIDMPVQVTGSSTLSISTDGSTWTSGSLLVSNGITLYGRFTSLAFNTSTAQTGTNSNGLAIGSTNPQTLTFSVSSGNPPSPSIFNISSQTRSPVIQELFNAEGPIDVFPNPDVDTVTPNPNTNQYISTGIDVTNNDIEIPVEIKANDPYVQARINSGQWIDVRSI